jgi:hypothetical protein
MFLDGFRSVRIDLGDLEDHRPRHAKRRRAAGSGRLAHRLEELGDGRVAAIESAFEAAAEQEVGLLIRERVPGEVDRGTRHRRLAAASAVAGRVDAEHRFVLLEQGDDGIESLVWRRLADRQSGRDDEDTSNDRKNSQAHGPSALDYMQRLADG